MSNSTCLYIQTNAAAPTRVIDVPWFSMRIGRARFCEVRLDEPGVPEVACRLQRRGRDWQLIPSGPSGSITLRDEAVDAPCLLQLDEPFAIGSVVLTLRLNQSAEWDPAAGQPVLNTERWSSQKREPRPSLKGRDVEPDRARPMDQSYLDVIRKSAQSLTTQVDPPGREVAVRPADNSWKARWSAASAYLRAVDCQRLNSDHRPPGAALESFKERLVQSAPFTPPGQAMPRAQSPAVPRPSTPASSLRPAAQLPRDASTAVPKLPAEPRRDSLVSRAVQAKAAPPRAFHSPGDAQHVRLPGPRPSPDRNQRLETASAVLNSLVIEPESPRFDRPSDPGPATTSPDDRESPVLSGFTACDDLELPEPQLLAPTVHSAEPDDDISKDATQLSSPAIDVKPYDAQSIEPEALGPDQDSTPSTPEPCDSEESSHAYQLLNITAPGSTIFEDETHASPEPMDAERIPRALAAPEASGQRRGFDLPSVSEVLTASAPPPPRGRPCSDRASISRRADAVPTQALAPASWRPPLWLVWLPTAAVQLALGLAASFLAFIWAADSFNASVVIQRLAASPEPLSKEKPLPTSVQPPEPRWWRTTPAHLNAWATYLGRSSLIDDGAELAKNLLDGAVRISPIDPAARLTRAQTRDSTKLAATLPEHLGLSRDVVSLAWSARALRSAGKQDAAIHLYRQAMEVNCGETSLRYSHPELDETQNTQRYLLPGESGALTILGELAADSDGRLPEWSQVIPSGSVAMLSAARLLQERGRSEAAAILNKLVDAAEGAGPASGDGPAIREAILGEALALLARWNESKRHYLLAVNQADNDTMKRMWAYNLVTIAHRAGDEAVKRLALRSAKGVAAGDEIRRRSQELEYLLMSLPTRHAPTVRAN